MDSPIILLIIWFILNVVIKSAKDKQKIEQARRKRASEINRQTRPSKETASRETLQREIRKAMSTLREEIDRQRRIPIPATENSIQDVKPKRTSPYKESSRVRVNEELNTQTPQTPKEVEPRVEGGYNLFDSSNDILKGVIYSEILSEPKSIQNLKRSI